MVLDDIDGVAVNYTSKPHPNANLDNCVDPAEALNSLSNLKKYKVNKLYIVDIKQAGWNMIVNKLEEVRRWSTSVKLRERNQIDEAVQYYVANQNIRRERRSEMMSKTNKRMKW